METWTATSQEEGILSGYSNRRGQCTPRCRSTPRPEFQGQRVLLLIQTEWMGERYLSKRGCELSAKQGHYLKTLSDVRALAYCDLIAI